MKVVEGQLKLWGMVSDLSRVSHSLASQTMRDYFGEVMEKQSLYPDILPTEISMRPEADSGKLVNNVS